MKRGGKREGAGRKPGTSLYGEPTKPMRIPLSLVAEVEKMLRKLIKNETRGDEHDTVT